MKLLALSSVPQRVQVASLRSQLRWQVEGLVGEGTHSGPATLRSSRYPPLFCQPQHRTGLNGGPLAALVLAAGPSVLTLPWALLSRHWSQVGQSEHAPPSLGS